jgi:hypothetical protein
MADEEQNGAKRKFELVRGYVLLGVGVLLVLYSLFGSMIEPAILTLGGAILGVDPVARAAK